MRTIVLLFLGALVIWRANGQATAYCHITQVDVTPLRNGVQITVSADGVLDYEPEGDDWSALYGYQGYVAIRFTNAKSRVGKNFIDVSRYPVSYIQLSIPQDAKEGVGVSMRVVLFEPSRADIQQSPDLQRVIITVSTERTVMTRERPSEESPQAQERPMEVVYRDGLASVRAQQANLAELLAELARQTGMNIAVEDSIQARKATLHLQNLPPQEALEGIVSAYGLALAQLNGVYMVSEGVPTDLAPYRLSGTESFRLKYTKAETAAGLLPNFLYSYLHVNEAQNAVVVTAPTQMLRKIQSDLQKIDIPPPQIMIEALAVEFSSTEDAESALSLLFRSGVETASTDSATGGVVYQTVGELPREFQAKLRALITEGRAQIRANPRMAAVNGQYAEIFIGQTRFIKVQIRSFGGVQEEVRGVDVGVKLGVRPWTGGNDEITITLMPEVSNISELDRQTGLPVLSTRRANTTVRVRDGETIVIGGLVLEQEYLTTSRIPILGDLPVLGALFQSRKRNRINTELVIFLTPYILTEEGRLKDEERERTLRERMLAPSP